MADVPAITLTDPNNLDGKPQSPVKANPDHGDLNARVAPGRPDSAAKKRNGSDRTESSTAWPSPGTLIRSISDSNAQQSHGGVITPESNGKQESAPAIDPLSQHILKRTHTPLQAQTNSSTRPRTSDGGNAQKDDEQRHRDQSPAPAVQEPLSRVETTDSTAPAHKDLRKGVKAVAFLSRLMGSAKRRDADEDVGDDESTTSEGRPEGNDAEVFTHQVDNMGFNPRHPAPPAYIKVRAKFKKERDFDRMFLAQELRCASHKLRRQGSSNKLRRKNSASPAESNPIWAMEFSRDGKYLAAAGADKIVRVWAVLSNPQERQKHEQQESSESEANGVDSGHLSAPVFQSKPIWEFEGHSSTVLDLSWSKNNFLLSSSMDKTVRLWHVSRGECLCTFKHNDFVPSISFHPKDDRFFLAGSLDSKLRLWSIPDKSVAYATQLPEMITAVAFTPDGRSAMAGCLNGACMFYETEGLKYQTQIHVRSTRGHNAKGSKITGIQSQYGPSGEIKILITSNDSRIRLYNFRDKALELKFKGNENNCSQIRAALSDDGKYVVCGSEDRKAYLWSMQCSHGEKRDRTPVEMFEAHDTITTAVVLAPAKTRQHLGRSEDPVYDLCNPPPVTLLSHAERAESQSHASSRPPTEDGSIQGTPKEHQAGFEKPREPASYLAKVAHNAGNIIVTADFTGKIKVFRQDCAWSKRQRDDWDKSSIFGKRGSRVSRNGSVATRSSQKSLRDASRNSIASDRIMSWRQGVGSMGSQSSKHTSRSISPRRSIDQRGRSTTSNNLNKTPSVRSQHPLATDALVRSPSPIQRSRSPSPSPKTSPTGESGRPSQREEKDPLKLQGTQSYLFWDQKVWKERADRMRAMAESHDHLPPSSSGSDEHGHLAVRPPLHQVPTYVSELSDERSSIDEFDDARSHGDEDEASEMRCGGCGGTRFAARREKGKGKDGGTTILVCVECGEDA